VKPAQRVLSLLVDPRLMPVFVLYFLTFLSMTTLQVALPLFAEARVGWGPVEVGRLFALFGLLGLVIQGWLIGGLSRRFGEHRLVIAGILASGTGLLGIAAAHTGWALVGGFCVFGIGLSATNPLLTAITSERAGPELRGGALGVAQSVGGLARTIGPIATGALYAHMGPSSPFVAGACAALVALFVATLTRPRRATAPVEVTGS
jgi:MFS family permease